MKKSAGVKDRSYHFLWKRIKANGPGMNKLRAKNLVIKKKHSYDIHLDMFETNYLEQLVTEAVIFKFDSEPQNGHEVLNGTLKKIFL